jgi:hypothetical protein
MNRTKLILVVLIVLNFMVLSGQIWPEGAPPFAKIINILTLVINLIFLIYLVFLKKKS